MIFKFNLNKKNFDTNVKDLFEIIGTIDKLDNEQKNTVKLIEKDIQEYRKFYDEVCKKFNHTMYGKEEKVAPIKKEPKESHAFLIQNIDTDEEFITGFGVDENNKITFASTHEPADKAPMVFHSKKTAVEVAQFANRTRGVKSFRVIRCNTHQA